jgi:gliding motility-associated lipoprotein GldH
MKNFGKWSWRLAFSAWCLVACSNDAVYNKYVTIENRIWDKQSEYFFKFSITDLTTPYDISLKLRNNDMYPFKNLWLFYDVRLPNGSLTNDTLNLTLADDFGEWMGRGISIYQNEFPIRQNFHFTDTGGYTIIFRQGMRENSLQGLEDIGLIIRKVK